MPETQQLTPEVMRKHQNATESAKSVSTLDKDVWAEAVKQWSTGNTLVRRMAGAMRKHQFLHQLAPSV
jgi:hypothetical protein